MNKDDLWKAMKEPTEKTCDNCKYQFRPGQPNVFLMASKCIMCHDGTADFGKSSVHQNWEWDHE